MVRILDLTGDSEREVFQVVDVEKQAIQELDELGQEIMRDWAHHQAEKAAYGRQGKGSCDVSAAMDASAIGEAHRSAGSGTEPEAGYLSS
jgi:hypothetical protein